MASNYTLFSDYKFTLLDSVVLLGGLLEVTVFMLAIFFALDYRGAENFRVKKKEQHINTKGEVNNIVQLQTGVFPSVATRETVGESYLMDKEDTGTLENSSTSGTVETEDNTSNSHISVEIPDDISVPDIVFGDIKIPSYSIRPIERQSWMDNCNNSSGDGSVFPQYGEPHHDGLQMSTFFKPQDSLPTQRATSSDSMYVNAAFDDGMDLVSDRESFDSGRSSKHESDSSGLPNNGEPEGVWCGHEGYAVGEDYCQEISVDTGLSLCEEELHVDNQERDSVKNTPNGLSNNGDPAGVAHGHESYAMVENYNQEISVDTGLPVPEQELSVYNQDRDCVKDTHPTEDRVSPMETEFRTPQVNPRRPTGLAVEVINEGTSKIREPYPHKAKAKEVIHVHRTESANQSHTNGSLHQIGLKGYDKFDNMILGNRCVEICVDSGLPLTKDDLAQRQINSSPAPSRDQKQIASLMQDWSVNPDENVPMGKDRIGNVENLVMEALHDNDGLRGKTNVASEPTQGGAITEPLHSKDANTFVHDIQVVHDEGNMMTRTETPGAVSLRGPLRFSHGRVSIMRGTADVIGNNIVTQDVNFTNETVTAPERSTATKNTPGPCKTFVVKAQELNGQRKRKNMIKLGVSSMQGSYRHDRSGQGRGSVTLTMAHGDLGKDQQRNRDCSCGSVHQTLSDKEEECTSVIRRSVELPRNEDGRADEERLSKKTHASVIGAVAKEGTKTTDTHGSHSKVSCSIENTDMLRNRSFVNTVASMSVNAKVLAGTVKGHSMNPGVQLVQQWRNNVISALENDIMTDKREVMV